MRITIGHRLTLWYGGMLAASLAAMCVLVYASFSRSLTSEIDRALDEELFEIEIELRHASSADERQAQLQKYFGDHPFYDIQVVRPDATVVFQSARIVGAPLAVPEIEAFDDGLVTESATRDDGARIRIAGRIAQGFDGPLIIQAADSLEPIHADLARLLTVLLTSAPILMLIALSGGYLLSRRALAPVAQLTDAAVRISVSNLDEAVPIAADDELGRLARAFNDMIGRLRQSIRNIRQFTADAAHELRTPLAVLRNEAEVTLRGERTPDDYREALHSQLEEIDRLSRLADQLLFLSREDSGQQLQLRVPVRIDELIEDVAVQLRPAATERDQTLNMALHHCEIQGDPDRLRRLVVNLLDNSIKYTPPGGAIRVSATRDNGSIQIRVEDTGVGIAAEHLPKLFDRFYRVDQARTGVQGSGLGLSICRSIVESQHGQIRLHSTPGGGTTVSVSLPECVESAAQDSPSQSHFHS